MHEAVDGELILSPRNNSEHGEICMCLGALLRLFADEKKLGAAWPRYREATLTHEDA